MLIEFRRDGQRVADHYDNDSTSITIDVANGYSGHDLNSAVAEYRAREEQSPLIGDRMAQALAALFCSPSPEGMPYTILAQQGIVTSSLIDRVYGDIRKELQASPSESMWELKALRAYIEDYPRNYIVRINGHEIGRYLSEFDAVTAIEENIEANGFTRQYPYATAEMIRQNIARGDSFTTFACECGTGHTMHQYTVIHAEDV